MSITIKDIAKAAGVSNATVSRALSHHPRISSKTIARIEQLADEMGYVPSAAARGLKTNRSHVVGVIVHRLDEPFLAEVLRGIEDHLQENEYGLFLATSHFDPKREEDFIKLMAEHRVEGVIITSSQLDKNNLKKLERFKIPMVMIESQALDESKVYSIYHDDRYGTKQLMDHLLALGHQRIAYLGNKRWVRTNTERLAGYKESLQSADLPINPQYIVLGHDGVPASGRDCCQQLLALDERPTAIVCYNDLMAIGAVQIIQEAGLSVPHDISVTGFDNISMASYITPRLTTFHQPRYELGQEAATMLVNTLNRKGKQQAANGSSALLLRGRLVIRKSTALPASVTSP